MYFSVSQTAALVGVCSTTIRRWDYCGLIKCFRTPGGHRRIGLDEIQRLIGKKTRKKNRKVALYSRVSSSDQKKKGDLERQIKMLKEYCDKKKLTIGYEFQDVAGGLNTRRRGLLNLFKLVIKRKINKIIVTYSVRLTRFGFEYISWFCYKFGIEIISIRDTEMKSVQQEMVDDLIVIITSFSGRIYGMRSRKNHV